MFLLSFQIHLPKPFQTLVLKGAAMHFSFKLPTIVFSLSSFFFFASCGKNSGSSTEARQLLQPVASAPAEPKFDANSQVAQLALSLSRAEIYEDGGKNRGSFVDLFASAVSGDGINENSKNIRDGLGTIRGGAWCVSFVQWIIFQVERVGKSYTNPRKFESPVFATKKSLNLWSKAFESRKNPTPQKPQIAFLLSEMSEANPPKPGWLAVWKKNFKTLEPQDSGHTEIVTNIFWENGELKISSVGGNTRIFDEDGDPGEGEGVFEHREYNPTKFGPGNQFNYEFLGFVNPFPF
jgi:hypothetical protein